MDNLRDRDLSLERLVSRSKVVSLFHGYPVPKDDNLKTILDALNIDSPDSLFKSNHPVAILAVIGPKGSGKSLLTNFLIEYLRAEGEGGWITKIRTNNENGVPMGPGFSWATVSNPAFFKPTGADTADGGIFMWPEPFLLNREGQNKIVVWVMHIHSPDDGKDLDQLEKFLAIACSRIMEIENEDNQFRILEHFRSLSSQDSSNSNLISKKEICRSIVYVIRSDAKISAGTDEEAKEALRDLAKESGKDEAVLKNVLDDFQHVNLVWMKNSPVPLHGDDGILNKAAMKNMTKFIKEAVETMIQESEIVQKRFGNDQRLTLGNMLEFLKSATTKISRTNIEAIREAEESNNEASKSNGPALSPEIELVGNVRKGTYTAKDETEGNVIHHSDSNKQRRREFFGQQQNGEALEAITDPGHRNERARSNIGNPIGLQSSGVSSTRMGMDGNFKSGDTDSRQKCVPEDSSTSLGEAAATTTNNDHLGKVQDPQREKSEKKCTNESEDNCRKVHSPQSQTEPSPQTGHVLVQNMGLNGFEENEDTERKQVLSQHHHHTRGIDFMEIDDHSLNSTSSPLLDNDVNVGKALVKSIISQEDEPMEVDDEEKLEDAAKGTQDEEQKKNERERKQEEKEEAKRLEMEKAKSEMEESFNRAISQIEQEFPNNIDSWINNRLNLSTFNQMETIYAYTIEGVLANHRTVVDPRLRREFVGRLDTHCKISCMQVLGKISIWVKQINGAMKKQFELHGYLSPDKLEEIAIKEYSKVKVEQTNGEEDGFVLEKVLLAITKLVNIYKAHNELIIDAEKDISEIAMTEVITVYHEQMKRYLKDAPYSPQKFTKIHSKLVDKLLDAFKNACHFSKSNNDAVTRGIGTLKEFLDQGFLSHKQSNETKLTRMQAEIKRILDKLKSQYHEKVEDVFKRNSNGLDVKTLSKFHTSIQMEMLKLLEMEIRSKIKDDEPLENHRKVLQSHIDGYWITVMAVNSKNIKEKEERDEKDRRQRRKMEAERELREQNEAVQKKKQSESKNTVQPTTTTLPQVSNKLEMDKCLPPLIFHLKSSRIIMAMAIKGRVKVLKNESGEKQTPAFIALTSENIFMYGSGALALVESSEPPECNLLYWTIADFFHTNDLTWSKTVRIKGNDYIITSEFLLAFLLRKLKLAIESEMDGRCDTTLLAIPFWLSSPQRIKIKDAAVIAGFSEVYLINEASAAAYNLVLNDVRSDKSGEVLVISEILDRVDTFVYSYSGHDRTLRMVAHSSNNESEDEERKTGFRKKVVEVSKGIFNYVVSYFQETETKDDDRTKKMVRSACKIATHRAPRELRYKMNLNEYLVICENSGKWEAVLNTVARGFGRKASEIREDFAVINGCAAFSDSLKEIGNYIRDKVAYDVLRPVTRGNAKTIVCKGETLPIKSQKHNSRMTSGIKESSFFQLVGEAQHSIGELLVNDVTHKQALEPAFEINNEAIVTLKDVTIKASFSNLKSETSEEVKEDRLHWTTPNLSAERLEELSTLLAVILKPAPREDPILTQAKLDLLQKCQQMTEKIESGQFKIKSSIGKDMILRKISEAREFAEHENSSMEGVQKQMEALEKFYEKYDQTKESKEFEKRAE